MSTDSGPGTREVAHRLFAAEFDDATLSYSESDEERAPNFVVTPTGARVNRLFAVGVLTEVESVNEETLRGRIVDPSGAFVTYAGQYQPDEASFLGRTTPPAFVAMTGKARTFEPDDSDAVYTSVRPESLNSVDADTRDRWTVSAAENTLHRIAVFAAALESGLEGAQLRAALEAADVADALAAGIPKAIEHYGTTPAYLEAVRSLAVQALEQVAGDREDVDTLSANPSDPGPAELGPLPDVSLELSVPEDVEVEGDETDGATAEASDVAADVDHAATGEPTANEDVPTEDDSDASTPEPATPEAEAGDVEQSAEPAGSAAEATDATAAAGEPGGGDVGTDPVADDGAGSTADEVADSPPDAEAEDTAAEGQFEGDAPEDDELGDFTPADDDGSSTAGDGSTDDADDLGDFDAGDDDALTDKERAEVEAEYGTDFTTGSEVGDPGEAAIDVPSSEEDLEALEDEVDDADSVAEEAAVDTEASTGDVAAASETDEEPGVADEPADDDAEEAIEDDAAADEPAEDVNLENAAVDAMSDLDDGDGALHDEVVVAVVDETGADPGAVEDAIQDALMSGQCYEPADGKLKAI